MSPAKNSVRPSIKNHDVGGDPDAKVGREKHDVGICPEISCTPCDSRPVFPVSEMIAEAGGASESEDKSRDEIRAADEEEEQAEMPLCLPSVYQPTRSEYMDHCVTHFPFRAWCKHCLEGRGREFGHDNRSGVKDDRSTPVVSFDYAFISDVGEITTDAEFEAAGDVAVKILVVRDNKSKSIFAHVVPVKGIDDKGFAVSVLVEDVKYLGYSKVVLKSDNEPAIVKLLTEALRELRIQGLEQCLEEHSPEYDPMANGSAEVGVKLWKGQFRTLKSCLESQIGYKIPVRHPLISWLVRHAACLIMWCSKGHDGRTAYQRIKGREFKTKLMAFGEFCRFKNRSHEPVANVRDGTRFHSGIFVGIDQRTGQYMIYSGDEIKLARTVVRVPELEKWNKASLAGVSVTPYNLHVPKEAEVVFKDKNEVDQQAPEPKASLARQIYLRSSDFEQFGMTRGCPTCDHYLMHGSWGTRPHSAACRTRVTAEIAKSDAGQRRIAAASDRLDRTVEAIGQAFRKDLPQGEKVDVAVDEVVQPLPAEYVPPRISSCSCE